MKRSPHFNGSRGSADKHRNGIKAFISLMDVKIRDVNGNEPLFLRRSWEYLPDKNDTRVTYIVRMLSFFSPFCLFSFFFWECTYNAWQFSRTNTKHLVRAMPQLSGNKGSGLFCLIKALMHSRSERGARYLQKSSSYSESCVLFCFSRWPLVRPKSLETPVWLCSLQIQKQKEEGEEEEKKERSSSSSSSAATEPWHVVWWRSATCSTFTSAKTGCCFPQ